MYWWSVAKEYSERKLVALSASLLYSSFLFHTDTHFTRTRQQSNPRQRCAIYWWSVTKEYGERKSVSLSLHLYQIHVSYFIQTLTDINLENNKIGDKWKQYLKELAKKNTNLSLYLWCKLKTLWEILFDSVWNKRNLIEPTESPLWKLLFDFLWRTLLKMF
jgi:hypothetical protein